MAATVVADNSAHVLRDRVEILDQVLGRLRAQFGVLLHGAVQVRHIRLVVLVMVQLHRRFIDIGLKSGVVIRQGRKFKWHLRFSCWAIRCTYT